MTGFKLKRVLLKLSGEALASKEDGFLDENITNNLAEEIKKIRSYGVELAIVIGGGNIMRGGNQNLINRENADYMGMLATVINSIALSEFFLQKDIDTKVFSAIPMKKVCSPYNIRNVNKCLKNGSVAILGGGTGEPYCTTDTAATLRAKELKCNCVLKATKVDGVYDDDPVKNSNAKKFDEITYDETLKRGLKVMDETSVEMAQQNNIPLVVFNIFEKDNIVKIIQGENIGTLVM